MTDIRSHEKDRWAIRIRVMQKSIGPYWELGKPKISALSAFSSATGFLVASGGIRTGAAVAAAAVFLLACGACGLNQYQEWETDALMARTKARPLPSGRTSPGNAISFSLCLIVSGLVILRVSAEGAAPFLLGLLALFWYNGVYTFLKRKTAFAAVPGALVGALPPAIGWTAGGGLLADPRLAFLCFFFFMWQIPHFWLLLLKCGKEYEAACLPSLTRAFKKSQLAGIVFVWTVAAAASVMLIGMEGIVKSPAVNLALWALSVWLVWNGARSFLRGGPDYSSSFHKINIFALIAMVLLSIDGLIRNITI
jgi:protoheme IX farnesyltransferase